MSFYQSCHLGKSTKLPFQLSDKIAKILLALIHSNVWCSLMASIKGSKNYFLFVDDFFRYSRIFLMQFKHRVFDLFIKFKLLMENNVLVQN